MDTFSNKSVLITGASGFIGSFVVERALSLGMNVWAAIRPSSSKRYLQDKRIRFITLKLEDKAELLEQLAAHRDKHGAWDYVVHAAGATKVKSDDDFFRINYDGTRHLCDALYDLGMKPERFAFVSSLSIFGPVREERGAPDASGHVYSPILDTDTPKPDTAYGKSKLAAEEYLHNFADFPYVILRPTGVYGPRDKDYFLMAKSIAGHVDFAVGYQPQEITFIYVKDLVEAIFQALVRAPLHSSYFISDGGVYDSRAFSDLIQSELRVKHVWHIKAPLWILRSICLMSEMWSRLLGKTSTLNTDKYHILKQRNWQCDISPARAEIGFDPEYDLAAGVKETIAWYKEQKWL